MNAIGSGSKSAGMGNFWLKTTILYLALPNLIFLIGWFRPIFGLPALGLVIFGLYRFFKESCVGNEGSSPKGGKTLLWVAIFSLFWTALSGSGGFVPQSFDYAEHNYLFHELAQESWPVMYPMPDGSTEFLCYSVAYYLPASTIAHFFGDGVLPLIPFLWTAAGVGLFFWWITGLGKKPFCFLLIVILYAGMGAIYLKIKTGTIPGMFEGKKELANALINAGLINSYLDLSTKCFFTPQHTVAAMLGCAMMYELLWLRKNASGAGFVYAVALLWSPLTSIGLLLFPVMSLQRIKLSEWFSITNLMCGLPLIVLLAAYYKAHTKLQFSGPIWTFPHTEKWPVLYLIFITTQLFPVIFILLVEQKYKLLGEHRLIFFGSLALVCVLPLYRLGYESDLRLQAATPALIVIAIAMAKCLTDDLFSWKKPRFMLLALIFCIGAIYPVGRPIKNLFSKRRDMSYSYLHDKKGLANLTDLNKDSPYIFSAQYVGVTNSFAYAYLLKHH